MGVTPAEFNLPPRVWKTPRCVARVGLGHRLHRLNKHCAVRYERSQQGEEIRRRQRMVERHTTCLDTVPSQRQTRSCRTAPLVARFFASLTRRNEHHRPVVVRGTMGENHDLTNARPASASAVSSGTNTACCRVPVAVAQQCFLRAQCR